MRKAISQDYQIPRDCLLWLLIAQVVVLAPHVQRLPLWLLVVWFVCVCWRVFIFQGRIAYPGVFVRFLMIIGSVLGIFQSYGNFFGLEPTVALLVCAYLFKILEMKRRRDALVIVYLGYFVIVTQFLFIQGMVSGIYMLLATVAVTTVLIALHEQGRSQVPFWQPFIYSLKLIAQALPLMLVLFVIFPRLDPFWSVPLPSHQRQTGVSDSMSPGDVTRLARSGEPAFRVSFEGATPARADLYWRGLVLNHFDGRVWSPGEMSLLETPAPGPDALVAGANSRLYRYSVILEPTYQPWLFALSVASSNDRQVVPAFANTLKARKPVVQRMQYNVSSQLNTRVLKPSHPGALSSALELPAGNPRARSLAAQWRKQVSSGNEFVKKALDYYRNEEFTYTLQPPALGEDSIDEFLFESRHGFCEHFASSFVFLMRSGGVPARIVVGYQGGEQSPYGNYLLVRQLDAHAWAEVWLVNIGWIRVDPTAWVAPDRIQRGSEDYLANEDSFLSASPFSGLRLKRFDWLWQMQLRYDQLSYWWQRWVLGYDGKLQYASLHKLLGEVSPQRLVAVLLVAMAVVLGLVALSLPLRLQWEKPDPLLRCYLLFCQRLQAAGVERRRGEAAEDFAARASLARPELAEQIATISKAFVALRYGHLSSQELKYQRQGLRHLQKLVQRFRRTSLRRG